MSQTVRTRSLEDLNILRDVFDAGHLEAENCPGGIDEITVDAVLQRAGVHAATAARVFQMASLSDAQLRSDLHEDLGRLVDSNEIYMEIESVLKEHADDMTSNDAVRWATAARQVVRRAVGVNHQVIAARTNWDLHIASQRAMNGMGETTPALEQFRRVSDVNRRRLFDLYAAICTTFGLRPSEPFTVEDLANLAIGSLEGIAMREFQGDESGNTKRPTGPNGALQEWTAAAVMFESLILSLLEPDPWVDLSADLSVWN